MGVGVEGGLLSSCYQIKPMAQRKLDIHCKTSQTKFGWILSNNHAAVLKTPKTVFCFKFGDFLKVFSFCWLITVSWELRWCPTLHLRKYYCWVAAEMRNFEGHWGGKQPTTNGVSWEWANITATKCTKLVLTFWNLGNIIFVTAAWILSQFYSKFVEELLEGISNFLWAMGLIW